MCSHEGSFGIVLIEAGSFGVPQIAFDSAQGAHEIITNNKTGYLIKNRDAKEFAKKANELINDKKKLKEFGASANKKALEFSFDNIKEKWLKFIKSL
jgi:N-acetylglucosaminyldiphosphoundecaprenol N-acetyl-beta-D-mannosaminyltransferase